MTTSTKDLSPAIIVGLAKVNYGFSIPPIGKLFVIKYKEIINY